MQGLLDLSTIQKSGNERTLTIQNDQTIKIQSTFKKINSQINIFDQSMANKIANERHQMINCYKAQMENLRSDTNSLARIHNANLDVQRVAKNINDRKRIRDECRNQCNKIDCQTFDIKEKI